MVRCIKGICYLSACFQFLDLISIYQNDSALDFSRQRNENFVTVIISFSIWFGLRQANSWEYSGKTKNSMSFK